MSDDSTPPPQVWPTLRARDARDARALIAFLVEGLGFTETVTHAGDDGVVHHAELAWPPGGGVMLGQAPGVGDDPADGRAADGDPWPLAPGSFGGYVVAVDAAHVDEIARRAVAAGGTLLRGPYDTDYGSHDVAVRDPEGNQWQFGTYRGHPVG